jgi:hypothetical protein
MPDFKKGGSLLTPFGKNVYLRSTVGCKFESYTVAAATIPNETIDGVGQQKILQPGTAMAKITSGPDSGKIGPFQASGTAEVQTVTPTTVTAGTFTLTITNPITLVARTTAAIAWNATMATVQAALEALDNVVPGDLVVAGAATANAGAWTVTFYGNYQGNVTQMTVDNTALTGTFAVTTTTAGVAGAQDGRQTLANVVGLNDTFLPWQLMEGDREIAVMYIGTAVQAWCFELNAAGARIALTNTQADGMRSVKGMDITFK